MVISSFIMGICALVVIALVAWAIRIEWRQETQRREKKKHEYEIALRDFERVADRTLGIKNSFRGRS